MPTCCIPSPSIPAPSSLDQAMKAAIDVCVRGEKYAAAKGLAIGFLAEDTRAICRDQASCQVSPNIRRFGASHPATVKVLTGFASRSLTQVANAGTINNARAHQSEEAT